MINLTDIYTAVNGLLNIKYPTYPTYGHEVIEGYDKPSFFVEMKPKTISNESVNYRKCAYTVMITYFQDTADEIDNLMKIDELKELFGLKLKVGDRYISILDFDHEFIGENENILQFSLEIEYFETIEKSDTSQIASDLILKNETR